MTDRLIAIPLKCAECGADIVLPGTYVGMVTHDPNNGKTYHSHCAAALRAAQEKQR